MITNPDTIYNQSKVIPRGIWIFFTLCQFLNFIMLMSSKSSIKAKNYFVQQLPICIMEQNIISHL